MHHNSRYVFIHYTLLNIETLLRIRNKITLLIRVVLYFFNEKSPIEFNGT